MFLKLPSASLTLLSTKKSKIDKGIPEKTHSIITGKRLSSYVSLAYVG
jgi:hypothetical protein